MTGLLWKATVRNVNRALKEINAFEWEGDYRPETANRLKSLLEERMDEELAQYLGRARHERRDKGAPEGRKIAARFISYIPDARSYPFLSVFPIRKKISSSPSRW